MERSKKPRFILYYWGNAWQCYEYVEGHHKPIWAGYSAEQGHVFAPRFKAIWAKYKAKAKPTLFQRVLKFVSELMLG